MADLGDLVARIRIDTSALSKMRGEADAATSHIGSSFGKMAGLIGGAFAGIQIAGFFKDAVKEAQESEKIARITANAISATGGAAKVTASQVGDLATSLSNKTAIDDELIQSGSNLILTFKNIRNEAGKGNDIFNQATAAALDLSAAGFGSVESASIQLGKALNDPIKGVTALAKSGVTFTAQQKDQIKALTESGDLLGAQKIILGEIQAQVGGAAAAAADPTERLKVVAGNLKETLGGALLPVVEKVATFLGDAIPKALDLASGAWDAFIGGFENPDALVNVGGLEGVLIHVGAAVAKIVPIIKELGSIVASVFSGDFAEAATKVGNFAKEVGPPLLEGLQELLSTIGNWIIGTGLPWLAEKLVEWGKAFVEWIGPLIPPALRELGRLIGAIGTWVLNTGLPLLVETAKEWGTAFLKWIGPLIPPMLLELGKLLLSLTGWLISDALPAIIGKLAEWGVAFVGWILPMIPVMILELVKLLARINMWIATEALPAIVGKLAEWAGAFVGWVAGAIRDLPGKLAELGATILNWVGGLPKQIASAAEGMFDGIKEAFRAAINWVIKKWNDLEFDVSPLASVVPGLGAFAGKKIGTPNIKELAAGGDITRGGMAYIAERGPELVNLPVGARVTPLTGANAALNAAGGDITVNIYGGDANSIRSVIPELKQAIRAGRGTR